MQISVTMRAESTQMLWFSRNFHKDSVYYIYSQVRQFIPQPFVVIRISYDRS